MAITNATNFRKNIYKYLENTVESDEVLFVTTKDGNAVLMSEDEYKNLQETLYLLGLPGMKEKIETGIKTPISECENFDWRKELG